MSEKKAKEARREEETIANTVVEEYSIQLLANNDVRIIGNIDNFLFFRDVMNRAERAVLERSRERLQKAAQKRIIT